MGFERLLEEVGLVDVEQVQSDRREGLRVGW